MKALGWSLAYWFIWIVAVAFFTLEVPSSILMAHMVIYGILGLVLYAGGLFFFIYLPFQNRKKYEKEEKIRLTTEENIKRFERERFLKQKYRTLRFEELVSDKDINKEDKLILLEVMHGYTVDQARKLLKEADSKEKQ